MESSALATPTPDQVLALPTEVGEPTFRRLAWVATRLLKVATKQRWGGGEHLPTQGGVLVVANHISNFDPISLSHFLFAHGRYPRFIGKAEIWKVPLLGYLARRCGQIPVERTSATASNVVDVAGDAIRAGRCVVMYPEGTITRDPDGWPMQPRTGAARIALATQCPVIPVASWGAQEVLGGAKLRFPTLFPRKTTHELAGPPVDLSDLYGRDVDHALLDEVGRRMMDAITALEAEIRQETPPSGRWDRKEGRRL